MKTGVKAIETGEEHMWQSAHSFFAMDFLSLASTFVPELQNVQSQADYLFSTPKPILEPFAGHLDPKLLRMSESDAECELANVRDDGKKMGLAKKEIEAITLPKDADGIALLRDVPCGSIRQISGHVHSWAFLYGMYKWYRAGKSLLAWKNAVLSVVIRVYNFRVSNADDELSSLAAVIDTEEALKNVARQNACQLPTRRHLP